MPELMMIENVMSAAPFPTKGEFYDFADGTRHFLHLKDGLILIGIAEIIAIIFWNSLIFSIYALACQKDSPDHRFFTPVTGNLYSLYLYPFRLDVYASILYKQSCINPCSHSREVLLLHAGSREF